MLFKDLTTKIRPKSEISLIRLNLKINQISNESNQCAEIRNYYQCLELVEHISETSSRIATLKSKYSDLLKIFRNELLQRDLLQSALRNDQNKQIFLKSKIDEMKLQSANLSICFDLQGLLNAVKMDINSNQKVSEFSKKNLLH